MLGWSVSPLKPAGPVQQKLPHYGTVMHERTHTHSNAYTHTGVSFQSPYYTSLHSDLYNRDISMFTKPSSPYHFKQGVSTPRLFHKMYVNY